MRKKKPSGYYWRVYRYLRSIAFTSYDSSSGKKYYVLKPSSLEKLSPSVQRYVIFHAFSWRRFIFLLLFFVASSFAFQGSGDCSKLLTDYAQLTNKSVFLPSSLMGSCVVQSEKHLPLILKSAGFNYKEKDGFIDVRLIPPYKEKEKEPFKPKDLFYNVSFVFLNIQNVIDCGLKMEDVLATSYNLDYSVSLGLSLGCPALDFDGSFAFRSNAHLVDLWEYSHGIETRRSVSTITSATGAVTTQYDYLTTGLHLSLEQNEKGVFYRFRYTGQNGSVTSSNGGIIPKVTALVTDEYTRVRYFGFIPLGKEKVLSTYSLILRIEPASAH